MGRDPALKNDIQKFLDYTNASWEWGSCPIKPQTVCVENWSPDSMGPYLPPYIPGRVVI